MSRFTDDILEEPRLIKTFDDSIGKLALKIESETTVPWDTKRRHHVMSNIDDCFVQNAGALIFGHFRNWMMRSSISFANLFRSEMRTVSSSRMAFSPP